MSESKSSWRDVIAIHPVAEVFPKLDHEELRELGRDIKENGLRVKVTCWKDSDDKIYLLDGINRLDAMELAGIQIIKDGGIDPLLMAPILWGTTVNPVAWAISANIRRRHLSPQHRVTMAFEAHQAGRLYEGRRTFIRTSVPLTGKPGSAPKKKGVRGSVKGEVGIIAELAEVPVRTARRVLKKMQEGANGQKTAPMADRNKKPRSRIAQDQRSEEGPTSDTSVFKAPSFPLAEYLDGVIRTLHQVHGSLVDEIECGVLVKLTDEIRRIQNERLNASFTPTAARALVKSKP
jgi:hypothetical protein